MRTGFNWARAALIGAPCMIALAGPAAAQAAASDIFASQTLGLELTKPHDWFFTSADSSKSSADVAPVDEAAIRAALGKIGMTDLFSITKHREPLPDLNPSVKVSVGSGAGRIPAKVFIAALVDNPLMTQSFFPKVKLVEPVRAVTLAGADAGYLKLESVANLPGRPAIPVADEIWMIPRGDYILVLQLATLKDEAADRRAALHAIVDTLKLTPLAPEDVLPPAPGQGEPVVTLEKPPPPPRPPRPAS